MTNKNWLIPFKGRNESLAVEVNFLWRHENIYVMDNHRTALWCWLQHIMDNQKYSLFHIDAHYDTGPIKDAPWLEYLPELTTISLEDYLKFDTEQNSKDNLPAIRWDNYLSLFFEKYKHQLSQCFMATHQIGNEPGQGIKYEHILPNVLPQSFSRLLTNYPSDGWIINIDIDYFFCKANEQYAQMFSQEFISELVNAISEVRKRGKLKCLTIALSPECCGGWKNAENMCQLITNNLKLEFKLI